MHDSDVDRIIKRYSARLREHGDHIATLASGTEERRRLRFDVLTAVGIEPGASVVDVGCGFGDYFGYLADRGVPVDYLGIDINPDLIAVARGKYPSARFQVADIQRDPPPHADFFVSTSAFNLPLEQQDNYAFAGELLDIMYVRARRGVAVDFLTSYVDYRSPHGFHYEPERLLTIAKRLTKRVTIRHDYPLFEFCVYLYPDFAGWGSSSS
jgi:SAM-dependent methyltransferase